MRFNRLTAITLFGAGALMACGDDDGTGGAGGGAETTAATTTTGVSTTTAATTTTNSSSSTGMAEGGGGGALNADAEPCGSGEDCNGGVCLTEDAFGWAGGYCSQLCSEGLMIPCEAGSICLTAGDASVCIKSCETAADCTGAGQTCADLGDGTLVCLGGCNDDAQCQVSCDNDSSLCGTAEICDSAMDEDADLLQDCEEIDCAADATCSTAIADACAEATDISAGGSFSGTTVGGTNVFARVCPGLFGNYPAGSNMNENVFVYNATASGILTIETSAPPDFDFDFYMRTDCDDAATNGPSCFVANSTVDFQVTAGQSYYFYVDAYLADTDYDLDVSFIEQVCGDNVTIGSETCDDGNLMPGDGCDATCQVEVPFYCNAAATLNVGANNGDTSTSVNALFATCGGDGNDVIYEFTATATGDVELVLSSASDQGIHVRSTCDDAASEIACVDSAFGGTDEELTLPVTQGTTYVVTVDAYTPGDEGPFTLTVTPL
ncbi:MAG: hypothetical protein HOV80_11620 [Polyangiaceae bacterium]|nr:hypothetical protein [Polyangiaceae bacterium]